MGIRSLALRQLFFRCIVTTILSTAPALALAQSSQPTVPQPQSAGPAGRDDEKTRLELSRLRADVDKVAAEREKLVAEKYTSWFAPAVSLLAIPILIATIILQRRTAVQVQQQHGQYALELKIAEFIMGSRSPAMARQRAELLSNLYREGVSTKFLENVRVQAGMGEFPGDLGFALRNTFFTTVASKYDNPSDILELLDVYSLETNG